MNRRTFLKRGLVGSVLLATAGGLGLGLWPSRIGYQPRKTLRVLDARQFAILAAVASRLVRAPGADPVAIATRVDAVLAFGSVESQADFRQLLLLLENGLAGLLLDGRARPFTRLDDQAQDSVLENWRDSRLVLRRSGYQALRKLTAAAHYASPATWSSVGYPGPPVVPT